MLISIIIVFAVELTDLENKLYEKWKKTKRYKKGVVKNVSK